MKRNPLKSLIQSRKALLLVMDFVLSTILYFVAKYAGESVFADIKWLILGLQPIFVTIINAIAKEDAALKSNGNYLKVLEMQARSECSEEKCEAEDCCE